MTAEPRQWDSWEELPQNVTVSDTDGDHWRKTRDGYRLKFKGKGRWLTQKRTPMQPDNLDAPYTEVLL